MKLGLNQSARLEQRLVQSPQMIQAMQILQLPALDLAERIQQELVENPFLELVEPERPEPPAEGAPAEGKPRDADGTSVENMLDLLERYERDFGSGPRPRARSSEEGDRKLEAMQNTPDDTKTLAEDLIEELAFLELDPRRRALAEYLLYSLDERGYIKEPLPDIARALSAIATGDGGDEALAAGDGAAALGAGTGVASGADGEPPGAALAPDTLDLARVLGGVPVTVEDLQTVLAQLRAVAHPAIGAHDLQECLLLQIDAHGLDSSLLRTLVVSHLEDIEHNRLPRIAKAVGRTLEEVKVAIDLLRTLDPNPGAGYGQSRAAVITPEVVVEEVDGAYEVRLDRQRVPEITLSPTYREFLRKAGKNDGVREWVKKRLESARWFIDAVRQRQSTLERIALAIFRRQRGFLDHGVRGLQPLRMQEVADEVGVHISTVSRAVSGKYAQTPRGIFPLKFFFTGGTTAATGEVASQPSIKQRIADLVAQEDPDQPLSDDQIAALLEQRDNIKIARRTVTKYRKALSIPASSQRRKF